jgi:hypothetical protein
METVRITVERIDEIEETTLNDTVRVVRREVRLYEQTVTLSGEPDNSAQGFVANIAKVVNNL